MSDQILTRVLGKTRFTFIGKLQEKQGSQASVS